MFPWLLVNNSNNKSLVTIHIDIKIGYMLIEAINYSQHSSDLRSDPDQPQTLNFGDLEIEMIVQRSNLIDLLIKSEF